MTLVATALLVILSEGAVHAQTNELVVASWGGKFQEGWEKSLIPNFERKYNAKVVWVPGPNSGATLAKLLAQKDNPQIDLAMFDDGPHANVVRLGMVEKLDLARLPNSKELYDLAFEPENYGIGFAIGATGILYNTKVFAENKWAPPTSWADLFRPELKGKVAIHSIRSSSGLNVLLTLNRTGGGNEKNIDPGFAKIKELKPSLFTIFNTGTEIAPLVTQEAVVISSMSMDDTATLADRGAPVKFVYPSEGMYGFKEVATIIKGRPPERQDLAYKFIDMLISKDEQENSAINLGFSPLNRTADPPAEIKRKILFGLENLKLVNTPDWKVVNENRAAWIERWSREIETR
jgi:putative spermidine/putrescine transport system substrate-binding protein